ncbi:MAG: fructose-bisphosphate aldolase class I [Robiginitomaculum sp.]|nr:MAG: fructose-bisphosphate aldolase class I [Robiginitomaculum sp.]
MDLDALCETATAMVQKGKGILAADESTGTIKKRFDGIGAQSTVDNRRDWREMLFRSEPAMQDSISGVILYDETLRQNAADGTPLVDLIRNAGAIPGIKVDMGAQDMAGFTGEKITAGLDGLRQRMGEYYDLGARFAKWRAVIEIDAARPSTACVMANCHALARYAAICQEAGIVPIVEPEVLMDGDHDLDRCYAVTQNTLKCLYEELFSQGVVLEGTVLKPNMVISGKKCANRAGVSEVAAATLKVLKATVPAAVPGIAFLSGGQSDIEATAHLNAMNVGGDLPWNLTFSYGRALQAAPLAAWRGKAQNRAATQAAFNHRARMNGLATKGEWSEALEG